MISFLKEVVRRIAVAVVTIAAVVSFAQIVINLVTMFTSPLFGVFGLSYDSLRLFLYVFYYGFEGFFTLNPIPSSTTPLYAMLFSIIARRVLQSD